MSVPKSLSYDPAWSVRFLKPIDGCSCPQPTLQPLPIGWHALGETSPIGEGLYRTGLTWIRPAASQSCDYRPQEWGAVDFSTTSVEGQGQFKLLEGASRFESGVEYMAVDRC